jgi:4-hydroxybenzoate polyprenyltransferase
MDNISLKQRLRGYIDLIRPFTLLAPVVVSACIMLASFFYNKVADDLLAVWWVTIIPASFSLAILNGASNTLNQITDVKADRISKPYRPITRGDVSVRAAAVIALVMYSLAFCLAIMVNVMFTVFVLLIFVFSLTYSVPPRMKDLLFLNQLWVAIPRGLLGILASWSVFGSVLHPVPITIGLIAMFFLIGGSVTKDILDADADKKTGTRTLINTFGVKKSAFLSLPFLFFPFILIPLLIECGVLDSYMWLLTFFAVPGYFIFYLMIRDRKGSKFLENTSSWTLMYMTYLGFASVFSILTVMSSFFA